MESTVVEMEGVKGLITGINNNMLPTLSTTTTNARKIKFKMIMSSLVYGLKNVNVLGLEKNTKYGEKAGKGIEQIIISQYIDTHSKENNYVVTYSEEYNAIIGWLANIEENGQQKLDLYFNLNPPHKVYKFALYQKFLLLCYGNRFKFRVGLIDFDKVQFLQLMHADKLFVSSNDEISIGFLSNGDLILVILDKISINYKIYKYPFVNNRPTTDTIPQIYDIKIPKNIKEHHIGCLLYQTKLFLFNEYGFTQWNLLTMTFDMEYRYLLGDSLNVNIHNIVINKNQTLLALNISTEVVIFSMKTGMWISRYDGIPIEFVTLEDDSEGLIIRTYCNNETFYKFLDPFHTSDAIDISDSFGNSQNIIITKSNKKISVIENNIWITDGLNKNIFQQMLNITYHNNIYTLPIFKTIQDMLKDINNNKNNDKFPGNHMVQLGGELFQFIIERKTSNLVKLIGIKNSQNNDKLEKNQNNYSLIYFKYDDIYSYRLLNNQDLALITKQGIFIYTVEDSLKLRYFWNNKYWSSRDYQKMLNDEFNDLQTSLPSPNFINIFRMIENRKDKDEEYKALILYIINDPIEFSKFGSEILKVVINEKNDFIIHIIQLIFDKIIELIKKNSADYSYMALISLYLPKLCDHYSHLVTKYIIYTSIPICLSIKNSTNTSLHAYSNNISIEKSIPSNNSYIKRLISFYKSLTHHLKIKEEIISFIIPFPQICKYQDNNYNNWNEILYKPKPILFYNIDTNNFYKWWNFAAIIDFKWKIFEKIYYLI
ncbi:unnamed protein product [Rhizophagus irregularis]|nr:unnamed protein product [Rhizophagus irregularis]